MDAYHCLGALANVYLEDSYVLSVEFDGNTVLFHLDVVLLESHEQYVLPKQGEQCCYRRATLRFDGLIRVDWKKLKMKASIDAATEIDFGNIDSFHHIQNVYYLSGDWGEVEIQCSCLDLILHPK